MSGVCLYFEQGYFVKDKIMIHSLYMDQCLAFSCVSRWWFICVSRLAFICVSRWWFIRDLHNFELCENGIFLDGSD